MSVVTIVTIIIIPMPDGHLRDHMLHFLPERFGVTL